MKSQTEVIISKRPISVHVTEGVYGFTQVKELTLTALTFKTLHDDRERRRFSQVRQARTGHTGSYLRSDLTQIRLFREECRLLVISRNKHRLVTEPNGR